MLGGKEGGKEGHWRQELMHVEGKILEETKEGV